MKSSLQFASCVPEARRLKLKSEYETYYHENFFILMSSGIQTALKVWVENGNSPYSSNRYGFFDSQKLKYLDFLSGELKLCQLLEIAAGLREPADCALNQFGEPSPRSWSRKAQGLEDISSSGFGSRAGRLLKEYRKNITKPSHTD